MTAVAAAVATAVAASGSDDGKTDRAGTASELMAATVRCTCLLRCCHHSMRTACGRAVVSNGVTSSIPREPCRTATRCQRRQTSFGM